MAAIENQYPKLVRDKIPEIVEARGKKVDIRVVSDDAEYLGFLLSKLIEEATELAQAKTSDNQLEELADVMEVLGVSLSLQSSHKAILLKSRTKRDKNVAGSKNVY